MYEGFTELPQHEAYTELRRILLDMKCQLIITVPPDALEVRQGSWFGLTPVTMAKHLRFRFFTQDAGTRILSQAFWPTVLVASLIMFYTTCVTLLVIAATITTRFWTVPLLANPLSFVILALISLIGLLALLHLYGYLRRKNAVHKVLRLLKARGSPLHRSIKAARLQKSKH